MDRGAWQATVHGAAKGWTRLSDFDHLLIFKCTTQYYQLYGIRGKESVCQCRKLAGDLGSILGSGKPPGVGNGNPLQDSCLENSTERGA